MNSDEKIRSQARMNAMEIQAVIDEAESGTISTTGLLVIHEDIIRMLLLYADGIQKGVDQSETVANKPHIGNIITELRVLNEMIVTLINDVNCSDKDRIVGVLERLRKALLHLADVDN